MKRPVLPLALLIVACLFAGQLLPAAEPFSTDANRLAYLDDFCEPYVLGLNSPKLITPQWIGEEGVETVITLGIDDMRDPAKYEAFLRPILDRLKQIDGRAPISIFTNNIDPQGPQLQAWLKEGLSLETHTADHPCPCLKETGFDVAKSTYDRCVDTMSSVPNSRPVAFRFPCCDSLNTPSPRAFVEILAKTTPAGNFLQMDTSVCVILDDNDPALPKSLTRDAQGRPRFSKYAPFRNFVNKAYNYPYPFIIAGKIWEMPIGTPDDWQGHHLQKPANPETLADMQAYVDAVVLKRGIVNVVFHPHGWVRNDQLASLIDKAVATHGKKVKFLTFKECLERINKHMLAGQSLRAADGSDNGVRILDVNNDGYMDVLIGNDEVQLMRIWNPAAGKWIDSKLPVTFVTQRGNAKSHFPVRFGVVHADGLPLMVSLHWRRYEAWKFDGNQWNHVNAKDTSLGMGFELDPSFGKGFRLRDLDNDGTCELLLASPHASEVYRWSAADRNWYRPWYQLPEDARMVTDKGHDGGTRLVDIDGDGMLDVLYSNERGTGLFLFDSIEKGWTRKVFAVKAGEERSLPMFARDGINGGGWIAERQVWFQNEETARLPDGVFHRSFNELLGDSESRALSPKAALKSLEVPAGFKVELVAAEPLTMDPVAFDWGPDGRLWIAEMADYPLGIDGKGTPGGRVRFLEDVDGDGKYQKTTLFLDGLAFPNGVMAWRDGVLISAAPQVIFARDEDHDGKCDEQTVLFDGFNPGNQQHRANGFKWSMDGWVHMANGDSGGEIRSAKTGMVVDMRGRDLRIKPDTGDLEAVTGQTQFGRNRDDWGHWFGTNNPHPLYQFVLDEHYLKRNPHVAPPEPRVQVADRNVRLFPASRTLARFNDFAQANFFTSANSGMIYRDTLLGQGFAGNLFVSEPVHNLVHREVLTRDGLVFQSHRAPGEEETHFLRSTDNWFRPTMVRTGPDGGVWVADMYRQTIEHPEWIPDDWERRLDLRAGHDKGRIYRVVPVREKPRKIERLDKLSIVDLVARLETPNGTERDRVQAEIFWRSDKAAIEPLNELVNKTDRPIVDIQAFWTLKLLGALQDVHCLAAIAEKDPRTQAQGILLTEDRLNDSGLLGVAILKRLMASDDPDVQLQLAYTLGEWNDPRAGEALGELAIRHANDRFLAAAVLSSVNKDNLSAVLAKVMSADPPAAGIVSQLFAIAAAQGNDRALADAVALVARPKDGAYSEWQLRSLAAAVRELRRGQKSLAEALGKETATQLTTAAATARKLAANDDAEESLRLAAMALISSSPEKADVELFSRFLSPRHSWPLQEAAVDALMLQANASAYERLFAAWDAFTPPVRLHAIDAILAREAWTAELLTRLENKSISATQLDAARRQRLEQSKSIAIRERAAKLFAAVQTSRADVVQKFQSVLSMPGDRERGREVFLKRCSACHVLEGKGFQVGPELTAVSNKTPAALLVAVLDPNRAMEDKYLNYLALLEDGRQLSGILTSESGASLTLKAQEGKEHVILRSELEGLKSTGKSLMPEGIEKDVTPQELADLFTYVGGFAPPPKKFAGNEPRVVKPEADGKLILPAAAARIFGQSAVFEAKYQNIGYWGSNDDLAAWTFEIAAAGKYEVRLDYACEHGAAGNKFILDVAGRTLSGQIKGTGSWDDYTEVSLGQVELPAGSQQLNFRGEGLKAGKVLLDLRTIRLVPVR